MPDPVRPGVRAFFERFGRADDAPGARFADVFLSLDPTSVHAVPREALVQALPRRQELFASAGATGLELADLAETPLDDRHTLVRTSWTIRFAPGAAPTAEPPTLDSTYLLRREGDDWQVVVYLNHQDLAATLAHHAQAPR